MVTMHRIDASVDGAVWQVSTFDRRDLAIPAGATLKRFLVTGVRISGTTNGIDLNAVGNFQAQQRVYIVGGPDDGTTLWRTSKSIPFELVGLYDVAVANRVYSQLINGGDETFYINERTSYGKRDGPGFTLRLDTFFQQIRGWTGLLSNQWFSTVFSAFYETLP